MGQPSADNRKDQSRPERQSGDSEIGSRDSEVDRDRPKDDRERYECRYRRQQADREGVSRIQKIADVLGYSLIGIVGSLPDERRTIEAAIIEPQTIIPLAHPTSPANLEHGLGVIFNQAADNRDRRPEAKHPEQQRPERGRVLVLDRVEPIPIEEA